ncbi:MAG: CPBP family glutamic-type intramembrane protease, partial [Polyangiaceae bacterium]
MLQWLRWLSFLTFVGRLVCIALVPIAIALPVYEIGRWRRARGAPQVETRWSLVHACLMWEILVFGTTIAFNAFAYRDIHLTGFRHNESDLSQLELARVGVCSSISMVLAAVPFTRKADWQRLGSAEWLNLPTLITAAKCFAIVVGISLVNQTLLLLLRGVVDWGPDTDPPALLALRAIREVYGVPVMIYVAAIAAPIAEEFVFRGVVLDAFNRHLPARSANWLQAILFALLHDDLRVAPSLMAVGVIT